MRDDDSRVLRDVLADLPVTLRWTGWCVDAGERSGELRFHLFAERRSFDHV